MIRSTSVLSDVELEFLLLNIQAYLRCVRRNHLALWMQGQLQALLPHRAVIVVTGGPPGHGHADYFGREPLPEPLLARLADASTGIVTQAVAAWLQGGRRPISRPGPFHATGTVPAHAIESSAELFGHGVLDGKAQVASFFAFFADEAGDRPRRDDFLETLAPLLHSAFMHVLSTESRNAGWQPLLGPSLTGREIEVLRWVQQGRSNASIAEELEISPLTVKNHVQSILKKLKAANRAQAVAFGISRRLLPSEGSG